MLAGLIAILTWKTMAYTVILVAVLVRLSVWKRRAAAADQARAEAIREREAALDQLLEMGRQVSEWRTKANAQAARVAVAQQEAAELRASWEAKTASIQPPAGDLIEYLREQAK